MITFSKDMLEALAGLSGPNDRFQLDEVRSEHTFYHPDDVIDEVTRRRQDRATHLRMNEDPSFGQLTRRQVPMHDPSAGVRKPQAYLGSSPSQYEDQDDEGPESNKDVEEEELKAAGALAGAAGAPGPVALGAGIAESGIAAGEIIDLNQSSLSDIILSIIEEDTDSGPPGTINKSKLSLHDIFLSDDPADEDIHYGFGTDFEELEDNSKAASAQPHVHGYGHGPQMVRRPGYGAKTAGYIHKKAE